MTGRNMGKEERKGVFKRNRGNRRGIVQVKDSVNRILNDVESIYS